MRIALLTALALATAAAACSHQETTPTEVETRALVATANEWTPADLTANLEVDDATRQTIQTELRTLHNTLITLHERYQQADGLEGEAREAVLEDAEEALITAHAEHLEFWNSLEPEVRNALAHRFHEIADAHGGDFLNGLHERMRRMHGDGSH